MYAITGAINAMAVGMWLSGDQLGADFVSILLFCGNVIFAVAGTAMAEIKGSA